MRVFIDTGAFCALSIVKDQFNQEAKLINKYLEKESSLLYTSNFILDETYTLIKARSSHLTSIKFMKEIEKSSIEVLSVIPEIESKAKNIFKKYDLPRLSFTDCTSFALIEENMLDSVFAFDEHFKTYLFKHKVLYLPSILR